MRYLNTLGTVLMAALALGISAPSAIALTLPDVHILSGESYPISASFEDNGKTGVKLLDTAGNELSGNGFKISATLKELSSLGEFEIVGLNVMRLPTKELCNTEGDRAGEVLFKGTAHIVPLPSGEKKDGLLGEFKEIRLKCGAVLVKKRGDVITSINFGTKTESEDLTELCGELKGNGKGKNNLTEYLNDNGEKVKAILEVNFGTGFLQGAVEVEGEVCPKTLEKKMATILNR